MTTYKVCFCYRRVYKAAPADPPEPIRDLFRRYSGAGGAVMGAAQLARFLVEVQGEEEGAAAAAAAERFAGCGSRDAKQQRQLVRRRSSAGGLTLEDFFRCLSGDDNPPLASDYLGVHQDMTAPLSHYYMYTGHNSYLTGNQLSSDSSEVPIMRALKNGVRVIELDMWPNSTKDDVNIVHGRTLTAPVSMMKCLVAIKEHAFEASPYPVILTLEDHLTPDLQSKVAKMLVEVLGEMLFVPESERVEEFPSPEDLKTKVVISTKTPKEYKVVKDQDLLPKEQEPTAWGGEEPDLSTLIKADDQVQENGGEMQSSDQDEDSEDDGDQKLQTTSTGALEYKHLIGITLKKRKGGLDEMFKSDPHAVARLSVSEQLLQKAAISHGPHAIRFTQRDLLRVFPKTSRIMSSNYNPLVGWMHGAQMVAFNMQGYGRPLWLMQGLFRANGGCGYVKKPAFLLNRDQVLFDPKSVQPVRKTLKVRVYMGDGWRFDFHQSHFDQFSPPDFYTRIGIAGVPADTVMKRTKTVEDSWTPVWDEEFVFPLTVPELALLRVEVHEYDVSDKDDFGGQTCLPVSELKSGVRAVPLFDCTGEKYKSVKLLLHFEFI